CATWARVELLSREGEIACQAHLGWRRGGSVDSRHLNLHVAPQDLLPKHAQLKIGQTLAHAPVNAGVRMLPCPPLTAPHVAAESMSDRITLAQCPRRRWP